MLASTPEEEEGILGTFSEGSQLSSHKYDVIKRKESEILISRYMQLLCAVPFVSYYFVM